MAHKEPIAEKIEPSAAPGKGGTEKKAPVAPPTRPRRRAANENRRLTPSFITDLRRRPSLAPYFFALVLSIVWLGIGLAYFWGFYGQNLIQSESLSAVFSTPGMITLLATFVLPIPVIWLLAMLIRRAQEMRNMSRAMASAAIYLSQPEGIASEAISSIGQAVRRELAAMSEGVERALGRASELEALVHSEVTALERAYKDNETRVKLLLASFEKERNALGSVGESLNQQIEPTIHRLKQENTSLQTLIEATARNLNALDNRLTRHADGLKEAASLVSSKTTSTLEQMTSQAQALKELAGGVLKDIHLIAGQFSEQAQGLNNATQSLKAANYSIEDVLKARHEKLAALAGMLSRKAEEVGHLMQSYTNTIDDTMARAEERAANIGRLLSSQITQSSETALADMEQFHTRATRATDKTAHHYQKSSQSLSQDITDHLDQTRQLFANTTQELRQTIRDLASELEQTRAEIASQVRELPDETRASTAALRQTVADELRALENLNQIVRKQTLATDTFQPGQRSPTSAVPGTRPPASTPSATPKDSGKTGTASRHAGTRTTTDTRNNRGKWSMPELLAAISGNEDNFSLPAGQPPSNAPEAPDSEKTRQPSTTTSPPPAATDTLNALSVDLARALDHQAPAELWKRFRRGETNVFSRQLYTLRGQKIFDEISDKYRHEPAFRRDVDKYIRDFENLLSSASESNREDILVETYLTSETGRVYLILAHASGRLGSRD